MQFVEKKTANYRIKLFYRYGEMPNLTLDLRPKQTINQFCSHIYENMQQDTSCLAVSWDTPSSRDTGLRRRPGRRSRTCRRRSWTSRSRRRRRSTGNRLEKNIFYTVRYHWFRFYQEWRYLLWIQTTSFATEKVYVFLHTAQIATDCSWVAWFYVHNCTYWAPRTSTGPNV